MPTAYPLSARRVSSFGQLLTILCFILYNNVHFKGTVSRESLQSAKTHLQQWQATGSGAFS